MDWQIWRTALYCASVFSVFSVFSDCPRLLGTAKSGAPPPFVVLAFLTFWDSYFLGLAFLAFVAIEMP